MNFVYGLLFISVWIISPCDAIITNISIKDNAATVKGRAIQIFCAVSDFSTGTVGIFKSDAENGQEVILTLCDKSICRDTAVGYTFSPTIMGVTIDIPNLSRTEHQKWFTCRGSTGTEKSLQVLVYTPPTSLIYTRVPAQSQDLSTGPVTMTCKTDCAYPQSSLKWFFKDGSISEYSTELISNTADCPDQERKYISSLTLAQFTTFSNNEDKTVKFMCGIPAVPAQGLDSPLYSPESSTITFSVKVTSVTLTDCTSLSGTTITVTEGVASQLCCNPSTSRPSATIVWYIDNTERKRSTETTFTFSPTNTDHNKNINCKAFNIPPETNGVTSKVHKLYVNVPVTSVTLKDGNSPAGSTLTVTQGVSKTLTCDPGTSRPASTIAWYKGGSLQDSLSTNYTFTPNNGDNGNAIYCTAVNSGSNVVDSGKPTLYVRVEAGTPDVKNKPSDALLSGDDVNFVCQTTATRPAASVTWKKGGVPMTRVSNSETTSQDGRITVTSTVTFTPVQSDHQKDIVCESAIPDQSSATDDRTQVTVWWPPSAPTVTPSTQFPWREGQTDKYLLCGATNMGNPTSSETWTSLSGSKQPDGKLKYASLTSSHDGKAAICKLENAYTQRKNIELVSQEVHLDVQYKPIVTVSVNNIERENITVNEGQSLQAMCTARGNPSPTVEWLGQTTNPAGTLSFQDIARTDDKTYTCRARATSAQYPNYGFTTDKMFNIGVNCAPGTPKSFKYIDGTHQKGFYWEQGFNGGLKQFFIIETSVDGSGVWVQRLNISEDDRNNKLDKYSYIAYLVENLRAGNYSARLYAVNTIDKSDYIELETTFKVLKNDISKESQGNAEHSRNAGVAAGVLAGMEAIVIIALVIYIIRQRHIHRKDERGTQQTGEARIEIPEIGGNPYCNVGSHTALREHHADETRNVYEKLDPAKKNNEIYETMETRKDELLDGQGAEYINLSV